MVLNCPFCGNGGELDNQSLRAGYGEYEHTDLYFSGVCGKCGARGQQFYCKTMSEFTQHTVQEFRNNPTLRAKVEDEYDEYREKVKLQALAAWNSRSA